MDFYPFIKVLLSLVMFVGNTKVWFSGGTVSVLIYPAELNLQVSETGL